MIITFRDKPVTLNGPQLREGDPFPDFTLTGQEMEPVRGEDIRGLRVFVSVPSVDTGVCDMEIRNFNKRAGQLTDGKIYGVSMDLPFAQARWCGAAGVNGVRMLSDYRDRSFGIATGTLIEELSLLTRAVFIVAPDDKVIYAEYVAEITTHPDYDRIFEKLAWASSRYR